MDADPVTNIDGSLEETESLSGVHLHRTLVNGC